ncbi:hypothetical protein LZG04_31940 [Saccharothrix sp. S26]|uniref:hypothetical protein n=1 Tax=Saccharothrix sp. S26 TaxID=2907215 RepID=UPI001F283842|nr:hypothetical protein [Saccharothrix sp. S26]MCE6999387.1 hypothetical protein [Saccharothrix sp. S26]
MQRLALVVRRIDPGPGRYRWLVVVPAVLLLVLTARVVSTDPVGYGVPFWPFANGSDRVEYQVMGRVTATARTSRRVDAVPSAVAAEGVEVLAARVGAGTIWMRVRLHVPDGTRCREVSVLGDGVRINSRRVDC